MGKWLTSQQTRISLPTAVIQSRPHTDGPCEESPSGRKRMQGYAVNVKRLCPPAGELLPAYGGRKRTLRSGWQFMGRSNLFPPDWLRSPSEFPGNRTEEESRKPKLARFCGILPLFSGALCAPRARQRRARERLQASTPAGGKPRNRSGDSAASFGSFLGCRKERHRKSQLAENPAASTTAAQPLSVPFWAAERNAPVNPSQRKIPQQQRQ